MSYNTGERASPAVQPDMSRVYRAASEWLLKKKDVIYVKESGKIRALVCSSKCQSYAEVRECFSCNKKII